MTIFTAGSFSSSPSADRSVRPYHHTLIVYISVELIHVIQDGAKRAHAFESACDFFLWGYLKSKVYVRKTRTVDDLKVSFREEIATLRQEMLVNVMQNFEERLRTCVRQEGRHLSDIIFRN